MIMVESTHAHRAAEVSHAPYEVSDIDALRVTFIGIGLMVAVLVVMTLTYVIYGFVTRRYIGQQPAASSLAYTRTTTPEPHLTVNAPEELRRLRASENATLHSYAWVDKDNGVVRIPIERAMEVLAKKGLPSRSERRETTKQDKPQRSQSAQSKKQ